MYKIIGGDGQQYGPVTAEQLREWIASGRADAQTLVQKENDTEWKPLSAFAEFTEALASKPPPALPPPTDSSALRLSVDATALANEILTRDYRVEIGRNLGRAWDLLLSDFWPMIGVSALVLVLLLVSNSAYGVGLIVTGPLIGGLFAYYLKKIRTQKAELTDAFAGFKEVFVQLMLGGLVSTLLVGVGFALCVVPGIYLGVAWKLTLPLIIDKRLGFWDAMEVSRKIVTKHWWSFFGLAIVGALINIGGLLLCGIGMFVTVPWTLLALMLVYEDLVAPAQPQPA